MLDSLLCAAALVVMKSHRSWVHIHVHALNAGNRPQTRCSGRTGTRTMNVKSIQYLVRSQGADVATHICRNSVMCTWVGSSCRRISCTAYNGGVISIQRSTIPVKFGEHACCLEYPQLGRFPVYTNTQHVHLWTRLVQAFNRRHPDAVCTCMQGQRSCWVPTVAKSSFSSTTVN